MALGEPDRGHLEPGAAADLVVVRARELGRAIEAGGPVRLVAVGGHLAVQEGAI